MEQEKNTQHSTEELHGILGLMDRMNTFIKKNGLKGTFTSLLTLFIASTMGYFIFNPNVIFEHFEQYSERKHEEGIKKRLQAYPEIRTLLLQCKNDINANRVFILEAHNGGTNLSHLPFLYADLTQIEPKGKFDYIEQEYQNIRLSRFPWTTYIIEHGSWYGDISECMDEDPELYYRLQKEGVVSMGMYVMYNHTGLPSACLGVIFTEDDVRNNRQIIKTMQKYSNLINHYLIGE